MKPKNCTHRSFWQLYKIINFNLKFSDAGGRKFICKSCGGECTLNWKGFKKMKKSFGRRFLTYFLWLVPAIIIIYLAYIQAISYIFAMLIVTIFHFVAMYFVINSDRFKIKINK